MQSDRWIGKGSFRSETKSGILTLSKKCLFDPNFFDRAIRSAHPLEKVFTFSTGCADRIARSKTFLKPTASLTTPYFFDGMCGSDCSIEKVFEAHRISHNPTKTHDHTLQQLRCWLDSHYAAAAAAAHDDSVWHILFSARQQRVPSSDGSSACYR